MGFKNTIEIITKDIQELEKIVRNFENYSRIPGIEMDLALDKTRNLYELLLMIKDFNNQNFSGDSVMPEQKKEPEHPATPELKKEMDSEQNNPALKDRAEFLTETKEEKEKEKEPKTSLHYEKPKQEDPVSKKAEVENEMSTQKKEQIMTEGILAEKFRKQGDFLNEKIGAEKKNKDLSSKMQFSPIKSISGSMGINDKFFFIRELFHGNADNFNIAMKTLDDASNFNEAYNFLINTFEWDMDSEEVQQLLNLIRRKFISSANE